ncbi:MAG: DUF3667 domain-containing protein [Chitinophagaceae bacterium]|nr:DUF3667 domain-containing protein [Chitinophagaceae bacterium]
MNCGATVHGRYCHHCSQENIASHLSFWSLTKHFIYDIFHFDGKFFDTLRYLLFRPGLVAREYIRGKRVRFLDPIRMYLFTSAVFFLIFFSLSPSVNFNSNDYLLLDRAERMELAMGLSASAKQKPNDTAVRNQLSQLLDSSKQIELKTYGDKTASRLVHFRGKQFYMNARNDTSAVNAGWLREKIGYGTERFKERYKDDYDAGANKLFGAFLHRLPYLFFISLPFFAGLLALLFSKGKKFLYSDHAIFSIYHYIFSFIILLLLIAFNSLFNWSKWPLFSWFIAALLIYWPIHLFLGMKNFYGTGYGKTFVNFLLLNIMGSIVLGILFIVFFLFSFLI